MINLNEDSWNQIISYNTDFADLKNCRLVSSDFTRMIELCSQNILNHLDLTVDENPSFNRILALESLIKKWMLTPDEENRPYSIFPGFKSGKGDYYNSLEHPKKENYPNAQNTVSKRLKKLNFTPLSLDHFLKVMDTKSHKKMKTTAILISYYTASLFPTHPAQNDLKQLTIQHCNYLPLAIEQNDTKTIQKLLFKASPPLIFDALNQTLARVNLEAFEQIITHIKKQKIIFENTKNCFNPQFETANDIIKNDGSREKTTIELFSNLLHGIHHDGPL